MRPIKKRPMVFSFFISRNVCHNCLNERLNMAFSESEVLWDFDGIYKKKGIENRLNQRAANTKVARTSSALALSRWNNECSGSMNKTRHKVKLTNPPPYPIAQPQPDQRPILSGWAKLGSIAL